MGNLFPYWRVAVAGVLLGFAGWTGYRIGYGAAADERADALREAARAQDTAVAAANRRADAESRRAADAQEERDRIARKVGSLDGAFRSLPRNDCDRWSDDERLLLDREREAYRSEAGSPSHVQRDVPGDARD